MFSLSVSEAAIFSTDASSEKSVESSEKLKVDPLVKWTALGLPTAVVIGYGALAWWDRGFKAGFYIDEREGFFGASSYTGGSDKLGHMWGAYTGSRMLNRILTEAGESKEDALKLSHVSLAAAFGTIELIDGLFPKYGAGLWDIVFNGTGIGFSYLTKKYDLDRMVKLSFGYQRSQTAKEANDFPPIRFSEDYTGMTHHLDINFMQAPALQKYLVSSPVLDLVGHLPQLTFRYHSSGFQLPEAEPFIDLSVGIGIDVVSLLEFTERNLLNIKLDILKDTFSYLKFTPMLTLYNKHFSYQRIDSQHVVRK